MCGEFVWQGSSPTNLSEGLSPDTGSHFKDSCSPLLQKTHIAFNFPAVHSGAVLCKQRECHHYDAVCDVKYILSHFVQE